MAPLQPMAASLLADVAEMVLAVAIALGVLVGAFDVDLAGGWWALAGTAVATTLFGYVDDWRGRVPSGALEPPPPGAHVRHRSFAGWLAMVGGFTAVLLLVGGIALALGSDVVALIVVGAFLGFGLAPGLAALRVLLWERRHGGTVVQTTGPVPAGESGAYVT